MKTKAWILSLVTYVVVSVGLIFLFDWIWPDNRVWTTIVPLVVGGLITHFVRKLFDFIFEYFNRDKSEPVLATSIKVDNSSRRFLAYGASNGEVLQAGNFKADYEVQVELTVTIQNETPETVYNLEVNFVPNSNLSRYRFTLIDPRANKLQPLGGDKHFDYKLRMNSVYHDVYAHEVDKDLHQIHQLGKGSSPLSGSVLYLKYSDAKQKTYYKKIVV